MESNSTSDDEVSLDMNKIAQSLRSSTKMLKPLSGDCCIYLVPPHLRELNKEMYTPREVSIGPFHHGKKELKAMEEHKRRYLLAFLDRIDTSIEDYMEGLKELEIRLRDSYVESNNGSYTREEFMEMMAVDGAFLMEYLLRNFEGHWERNDRIFGRQHLRLNLRYDLLLIENQIPFFFLKHLFGLLKNFMVDKRLSLMKIVQYYLCDLYPWDWPVNVEIVTEETKVEHILHFLIICLQQSGSTTERSELESVTETKKCETCCLGCPASCSVLRPTFHSKTKSGSTTERSELESVTETKKCETCCLGCPASCSVLHPTFHSKKKSGSTETKKCETSLTTPSILQLHEAGMRFKAISTNCLSNIKFSNGILEIPNLKLTDEVERLFRNMQAFEHCHRHGSKNYISDYITIMDVFINNEEDVKVLVRNGIIDNWLEDDRAAATVFNNLGKGNCIDPDDFCYSQVIEDLNTYYKIRRHKWKATFKHKYLNNPWTIISVFAAAFLLLLTITQTVCSILQVL